MGLHKGRKRPQFEPLRHAGQGYGPPLRQVEATQPKAKVLYLMIKAKHNGTNNGDIILHYSELKTVRGFSSPSTVSSAFKELEKAGWITKDSMGGMYRIPNKYKLTGKA